MTHSPGREIVLDTETTGFSPHKGDRLVEIGCVELRNYLPTGRTFQVYINPERDMPAGAFGVHGLSEAFLRKFSPFKSIVRDFLDFIEDSPLVIHNAPFDMGFIQAELDWAGLEKLANPVLDTLAMAKNKFPGAPASLDMLCRRFQINNSHREKHGALLDAEILAQVYLELSGGRQPVLSLEKTQESFVSRETGVDEEGSPQRRPHRKPRLFEVSIEESRAHEELFRGLGAMSWAPPSRT